MDQPRAHQDKPDLGEDTQGGEKATLDAATGSQAGSEAKRPCERIGEGGADAPGGQNATFDATVRQAKRPRPASKKAMQKQREEQAEHGGS